MAQSFQVAPEYVDEITFTTKVSSIEYRVSNQIQVSINIVGIRYRTSTSHNIILCSSINCVAFVHRPTTFRRDAPPASALCNTATHRFYHSEKSTLGCQGITVILIRPNFWRSCPALSNNDRCGFFWIFIFFDEISVSETSGFHVHGVKSRSGQRTSVRIKKYRPRMLSRILASHIIISPTLERCAPRRIFFLEKAHKLGCVFTFNYQNYMHFCLNL